MGGTMVGGVGGLGSGAGKDFSSVQEAIALEGRLKALADSIVVDIVEEIRRHPLAGVRQLSVSPSCFVVRFSSLLGENWSPEFYSAESQARLVESALRGLRDFSVHGIVAKIRQMVSASYVSVDHTPYGLNPETLAVLRGVLALVEKDSAE